MRTALASIVLPLPFALLSDDSHRPALITSCVSGDHPHPPPVTHLVITSVLVQPPPVPVLRPQPHLASELRVPHSHHVDPGHIMGLL